MSTCIVCHDTKGSGGVCSSALGPISLFYCSECLERFREPEFLFQMTLDTVGSEVADHVRTLRTMVGGEEKTWDEWAATATPSPMDYFNETDEENVNNDF